MKNQMFKHLLDKLEAVIKNPNYYDQREGNAVQKFSALLESLDTVVDCIDNCQNLDEKEYAKRRHEIENAFIQFQDNCEEFLTVNKDELLPEMKDSLIYLTEIQRPMETIMSNLKKGNTLNEALSDPSWMKDIFADDEAVKDREDYVPGQYSIENMSYKEILDQYKIDHDDVNAKYTAHIQKISRNKENPTNTITTRLALIQDYANSFNDGKNKLNLNYFISDGYRKMEKRMNRSNIDNISSSELIMGKTFFDLEADRLYQRTAVLGEIGHLKGLPNYAVKLIESETNKLRFKPDKMGITKEQIERLEAFNFPIRILKTQVDLMRMTVSDIDKSEECADVMKSIDSLISNIQGYLKDDGSHAPTDKEFINVAKSVKKILDDNPLLYTDGALYKVYEGMAGIHKYIYESVPSVRKTLEKDYKAVQNSIKNECLNVGEQLLDKNLNNTMRFNMEKTLGDVYDDMLIDREFMFNAMYIRMARDPEYNQRRIEDCMKALADFDKNKDTQPGSTTVSPFLLDNYITAEKHTPQELYDEVYTMLLVGQKIAIEREKFDLRHNPDKHLTSVEKLKNSVHPGLDKIMSAKSLDYKLENYMKSFVVGLKKSEIYHDVQKFPADKMLQIAKNPDLSHKLGKALENHENNLLRGVDDKTLAALTQDSGAFYWPNSDSYKKVSDNIKSIFQKRTMAEGVKTEDYKALYLSLESYSRSHDSYPTLDNGKLRANAVINMMSVLGKNLAKADPSLKTRIEANRMVNMTRSKAYRDAVAKQASGRLKELVAENKNQIESNYNALPKDVREEISDCIHMAAFSDELNKAFAKDSVKEFRGKISDPKVEGHMIAKMSTPINKAKEMLLSFEKNPASMLKAMIPDSLKKDENILNI